jgi:DNA-binding NarL/FixJ family response regulator
MGSDATQVKPSKQPTWRLIIADDHELARAGLRSIFQNEAGFEIVGEATNGCQAVDLCNRLNPDLILLDVQMPEMDGMAATRAIKAAMPSVCVIIVSMHESAEYLLEALRAGAAGYLLKEATRREMITTVRQVLRGETILNGDMAVRALQCLARDVPSMPEPLLQPLTPRESEVLQHIAKGETNREIATALTIVPGTVKIHVERIIAKLGVSDRTQAAVRAIELGLHKRPIP